MRITKTLKKIISDLDLAEKSKNPAQLESLRVYIEEDVKEDISADPITLSDFRKILKSFKSLIKKDKIPSKSSELKFTIYKKILGNIALTPFSAKDFIKLSKELSDPQLEEIKQNLATRFLAQLQAPDTIEEFTTRHLDSFLPAIKNIKPSSEEDFKQVIEIARPLCIKLMRLSHKTKRKNLSKQRDLFFETAKLIFDSEKMGLEIKPNNLLIRLSLHGGPIEFLQLLFDAGENFKRLDVSNTKFVQDNTALIWAIANANNEFAYRLLDFTTQNNIDLGIDFVSIGNTALILAVAKGYIEKDSDGKKLAISNTQLVAKLISSGANPNIKSDNYSHTLGVKCCSYKYSALDIAVARLDIEMIETIMSSPKIELQTLKDAQELLRDIKKYSHTSTESGSLSERILSEISSSHKKLDRSLFTETNFDAIETIIGKKISRFEGHTEKSAESNFRPTDLIPTYGRTLATVSSRNTTK